MLFIGMVAAIVGWRGGRENRAVPFANALWDSAWHEMEAATAPLHSFILCQCSQLTIMQVMVLIVCIHQHPPDV